MKYHDLLRQIQRAADDDGLTLDERRERLSIVLRAMADRPPVMEAWKVERLRAMTRTLERRRARAERRDSHHYNNQKCNDG